MLCLVFFAQHLNLHSLFEKREWLCKIANAELILSLKLCVFDFEVKPLLVAFSIGIDFAKKVVFLNHLLFLTLAEINVSLANLLGFNSVKIATFNHRIKGKQVRFFNFAKFFLPCNVICELRWLGIWRRESTVISHLKLLIGCKIYMLMFQHTSYVLENNMEHVLSHQVCILWSVGFIDCLENYQRRWGSLRLADYQIWGETRDCPLRALLCIAVFILIILVWVQI